MVQQQDPGLMARVYYNKWVQSKFPGRRSGRTRSRPPRVPPVECQHTLNPQDPSCENTWGTLPAGDARSLETVPRVYQDPSRKHPPTWHAPRFPAARREAGAQPEPYCLRRQFRLREPLLSFRRCWDSPRLGVPRCSQGPPRQPAFHKIAVMPAR